MSKTAFGVTLIFLVVAGGPASSDDLYEYGEYLIGECQTCHHAGATKNGIPPLPVWSEEAFLDVMDAYGTGALDNAVMKNVVKSLGDNELKALARYLSLQETEEEKQ